MISTGIAGTARQDRAVQRQQRPGEDIAVRGPAWARIAAGRARMCGASGGSPIIFSAK